MSLVTVRPFGDLGFLIEPQSLAPDAQAGPAALALTEWVVSAIEAAQSEWPEALTVAGIGSLLIEFPAARPSPARVGEIVSRGHSGGWPPPTAGAARRGQPAGPTVHDVATVYRGPDLAEVAIELGMTVSELVARHSGAAWTVAAVGFTPGFAYLVCGDPAFSGVARRAEPRRAVPAGAVALAAGMSAIYPQRTPGGWRLLGETSFAPFDPERDPPTLLRVGDQVRFRPVPQRAREGVEPRSSASQGRPVPGGVAPRGPAAAGSAERPSRRSGRPPGYRRPAARGVGVAMDVLVVSGLALLQDAGRHLVTSGVPRSGAFDRVAHSAANRLVGGSAASAAIEVVGHISVRPVGGDVLVAATGTGDLAVDGRHMPGWTCIEVAAGSSVDLVAPAVAYLAVSGGFAVQPVLGSRSTCVMGPMGPEPLLVGDRIPVGPSREDSARDSAQADRFDAGLVGAWCEAVPANAELRAVPGPHLRLPEVCTARVVAWSRLGVRIEPSVHLHAPGGLRSIPVRPGTIQVLPGGDWIILGPDAGTMGGYPVAGVLVDVDRDMTAHLLPGQEVRIRSFEGVGGPPRHPSIIRPGLIA